MVGKETKVQMIDVISMIEIKIIAIIQIKKHGSDRNAGIVHCQLSTVH